MLPEPPRRQAQFGELVALATFTVAFCALILLSPVITFKNDGAGEPVGPLSPWLFDNGIAYVFVALVMLSLVGAFVKYYRPPQHPARRRVDRGRHHPAGAAHRDRRQRPGVEPGLH